MRRDREREGLSRERASRFLYNFISSNSRLQECFSKKRRTKVGWERLDQLCAWSSPRDGVGPPIGRVFPGLDNSAHFAKTSVRASVV